MVNLPANTIQPIEHRHDTRTHLFVVATLCWGTGTEAVHVRNMSSKGALIEAKVLPKLGSLVVLKRGSIEASARVAWTAARRAGLTFGGMVNVPDWMAKRANSHQHRIDEIVSQLKSEEGLPDKEELGPSSGLAGPSDTHEQLELLRADLIQLGNILVADIILVATHPEIQLVDIAVQRVEKILQRLS